MSKRGYMSTEILSCQFSVYPLLQPDIDGPVQAAIQAASAEGCSVRVGNLSTLVWGSEDQVFAALRAAFRAAQRSGPAVMTATLAAGMPTDELVGEIQRDVGLRDTDRRDTDERDVDLRDADERDADRGVAEPDQEV